MNTYQPKFTNQKGRSAIWGYGVGPWPPPMRNTVPVTLSDTPGRPLVDQLAGQSYGSSPQGQHPFS